MLFIHVLCDSYRSRQMLEEKNMEQDPKKEYIEIHIRHSNHFHFLEKATMASFEGESEVDNTSDTCEIYVRNSTTKNEKRKFDMYLKL